MWDVEGKRYLDFFGGILTTSVGHNHPRVVEAVREQVGKLIHSSTLYPNANHVALAEKMAEITPGRLQMSYFTNSGSEANETAIVAGADLHRQPRDRGAAPCLQRAHVADHERDRAFQLEAGQDPSAPTSSMPSTPTATAARSSSATLRAASPVRRMSRM